MNKETIASLNDEQMGAVKGGFTYSLSTGARCRKSMDLTGTPKQCKAQ